MSNPTPLLSQFRLTTPIVCDDGTTADGIVANILDMAHLGHVDTDGEDTFVVRITNANGRFIKAPANWRELIAEVVHEPSQTDILDALRNTSASTFGIR